MTILVMALNISMALLVTNIELPISHGIEYLIGIYGNVGMNVGRI